MSVRGFVTGGVYGSAVASAAVYVNGSGKRTAVNVVRLVDREAQLTETGTGITGLAIAFRALQSDIPDCPHQGETLEVDGECYQIDEANELNRFEWVIYVRA